MTTKSIWRLTRDVNDGAPGAAIHDLRGHPEVLTLDWRHRIAQSLFGLASAVSRMSTAAIRG